MKIEKTYTAVIYVGFLERDTGRVHSLEEALDVCQEYVDKVGLCVSVEPIWYIYTGGREPGCAVTMINYPRFPSRDERIREKSLELAQILLEKFDQYKVSIVTPQHTYMIGREA